jgi:hypothetical protein
MLNVEFLMGREDADPVGSVRQKKEKVRNRL